MFGLRGVIGSPVIRKFEVKSRLLSSFVCSHQVSCLAATTVSPANLIDVLVCRNVDVRIEVPEQVFDGAIQIPPAHNIVDELDLLFPVHFIAFEELRRRHISFVFESIVNPSQKCVLPMHELMNSLGFATASGAKQPGFGFWLKLVFRLVHIHIRGVVVVEPNLLQEFPMSEFFVVRLSPESYNQPVKKSASTEPVRERRTTYLA